MARICIGHHGGSRQDFTRFQQHTGRQAVFRNNGRSPAIPYKGNAMALCKLDERLHQSRHSAFRKPDSPLAFDVMDQAVNTGRVKGVSADQQRLYAESAPYPFVPEIVRSDLVDRPVGAQPGHSRSHSGHRQQPGKRLGSQLHIAFFIQLAGMLQKCRVALCIRG